MSNCAACEERLPDLADGALGVIVTAEVERHLAGCASCGALKDSLARARRELHAARVVAGETSALAARIAYATWRRPRRLQAWWPVHPDRGGPPWRVQGLAAGMSVGVSLLIYIVALATHDSRSLPARLYRSVNNGAADVRSRGESWMEDLRLIKVLLSTTLGGRMDQVEAQVDDYRRLMEKRRPQGAAPSPSPKHRTPEAPSS